MFRLTASLLMLAILVNTLPLFPCAAGNVAIRTSEQEPPCDPDCAKDAMCPMHRPEKPKPNAGDKCECELSAPGSATTLTSLEQAPAIFTGTRISIGIASSPVDSTISRTPLHTHLAVETPPPRA